MLPVTVRRHPHGAARVDFRQALRRLLAEAYRNGRGPYDGELRRLHQKDTRRSAPVGDGYGLPRLPAVRRRRLRTLLQFAESRARRRSRLASCRVAGRLELHRAPAAKAWRRTGREASGLTNPRAVPRSWRGRRDRALQLPQTPLGASECSWMQARSTAARSSRRCGGGLPSVRRVRPRQDPAGRLLVMLRRLEQRGLFAVARERANAVPAAATTRTPSGCRLLDALGPVPAWSSAARGTSRCAHRPRGARRFRLHLQRYTTWASSGRGRVDGYAAFVGRSWSPCSTGAPRSCAASS